MNNIITTSLIITTYNWHQALELVLESVKGQIVFPSEVIIADDGSNNSTTELIKRIKKDFPVPINHVWQEDNGFRKSIILNKAIAHGKGDYIIQIDGDIILHKNFIQDHISSAEKGTYLYGSRINIQERYLAKLFKNKIVKFSYLSKGIKKRNRNIYLPLLGNLLYKKQDNLSRKLRGCNLSYWKSDFIAVNGYNGDMVGWGREDSELIIRMINNGILGKRMKFKAIIYHIWHKESPKEKLNINDSIQDQALNEKKVWCNNGINKYLREE